MHRGLFVGLATLDVVGYVDQTPDTDEKVEALDMWTGLKGPSSPSAVEERVPRLSCLARRCVVRDSLEPHP
jgi:hypothetical protein